MLKKRLIPQLLISENRLVKTYKFSNQRYIGDPINAVSIFNEKKADEIFIIDIKNYDYDKAPDFEYISKLASECFMPFAYGGRISNLDTAKKIFDLGIEKIVIQKSAFLNNDIISDIANKYGSQSVVISIDLKKNIFGNYHIYNKSINIEKKSDLIYYIDKFINLGAGEILINCVDLEGTFNGLDNNILMALKKKCKVPMLLNGGLKNLDDAKKAFQNGADGVVAGSYFVFYGKHRAVLITYPEEEEIYRL